MKVALAQFIYESNTFNPREADLEYFTQNGSWVTETTAVRQWAKASGSQLEGSLAVLEAAGVTTVPVFVAMCGTPGGRLSHACYAQVRQTLHDCLQAALPADALLLHLHGAVCAVGVDDVEGDLLVLVREELGFTGRVVISLDLHANVTPLMLQYADAVTAYRTFPHQDFYSTGERAAQLVLKSQATVRTLAKLAVLVPPTATDHRAGHFAALLQQAREFEQQPGIIDVSLFPVQPWLDINGMGTSVVVTATTAAAGRAIAEQLAESWYVQRHAWPTGLQPWSTILNTLASRTPAPWLLVDTADATTGGSDGTSAEAICRLWPLRDELPGEVLLWVVDPAAVAAAQSGEKKFRLGATGFPVEAGVMSCGEARYRARGRAYTGQEFSAGRAAVLRSGQMRIVVTEAGSLCADPAFYECLGLHPESALAVQVKSHMGWQAGYEVGPERGLRFDGPGCTSLNFARLPFTGARLELFPLTDSPPNPISHWQSI